MAQTEKNLPVLQETWVQFLGQKETLEKGMVTHSSILAWRIPWTEEPGGLQSIRLQRVRQDEVTSTSLSLCHWIDFVCVCVCACTCVCVYIYTHSFSYSVPLWFITGY